MTRSPRWLANWLERHRTPLSFWLHMVGIPLTIAAGVLLIWQLLAAQNDPAHWRNWWRPALLFVAGYGLQYLGHIYEGNDMGEVIVIKRWLGLPYVAIGTRRTRSRAAG